MDSKTPPPIPPTADKPNDSSSQETWPIHRIESIQEEDWDQYCRSLPLFKRGAKDQWSKTDYATEFGIYKWQCHEVTAMVFRDQHTLEWWHTLSASEGKFEILSETVALTYIAPLGEGSCLPEDIRNYFRKPLLNCNLELPLPIESFIPNVQYKTALNEANALFEHRAMSQSSRSEMFQEEIVAQISPLLEKKYSSRWEKDRSRLTFTSSYSEGFIVKFSLFYAGWTRNNKSGYLLWTPFFKKKMEGADKMYDLSPRDLSYHKTKYSWAYFLAAVVILILPVSLWLKVLLASALIGVWAYLGTRLLDKTDESSTQE